MADALENFVVALFVLAVIFSALPPGESREAFLERRCVELMVDNKVHSWEGCIRYLERHSEIN